MIVGRFGANSGRPYVDARIVLPRLGREIDVAFCLDTGADSTVLSAEDAALNGLPPVLSDAYAASGVGGEIRVFIEPAWLVFDSSGQFLAYDLDLAIAARPGSTKAIPSLLGRDVVNRWDIRYRFPDRILRAQPLSCDIELAPVERIMPVVIPE